ncbi:uncharacterized protein LOC128717928 [Anopheles marshallii]|uniref:uncharacterized protein LOC128717928 n=1 Tax=Anopheles marshallii TaxID=1521116 RepID=UPI00237A35E4|nr:uncharacterized protein LOC128717928 [Anopheles marshallii]
MDPTEKIAELVSDFTRTGIVKQCESRGLSTTGTKEELAKSIVEHDAKEEANETVFEDTESDDKIKMTIMKAEQCVEMRDDKRVYSFRDVEEAIDAYGDDVKKDVKLWIREFEDIAKMCGITSYTTLRDALIREFGKIVRASDVHRELAARRKKEKETMLEYTYAMQRIAQVVKLDEVSLCEYIADGATADARERASLYEAKDLDTLKSKLDYMERANKKADDRKKLSNKSYRATEKHHCFNCGSIEHKLAECPTKDKGPKCFQCGIVGHRASECKDKRNTEKRGLKCFVCDTFGHLAKECVKRNVKNENSNVNLEGAQKDSTIVIAIENIEFNALFDSGCLPNILSVQAYLRIGSPKLSPTTMVLTGFGGKTTKAYGTAIVNMTIDGVGCEGLTFHVVPDQTMPYEAILGRASLEHFGAIVTAEGVKIVPKEENSVMAIGSTEGDIDVPPRYYNTVKSLIDEYEPVKEVTSVVEMKIIVEDDTPIRTTPRRFAPKEKKVIENTLCEWLKGNIIQKSDSDYASPVVLARKKDGSMRVCVDYRELNRKVRKDCFPMRNMEDQIDQLQAAKVFTTLDLKNSFFHVPIEQSSRKYTAFVTHTGQYEFLRAPFGFCNSPAVFGRFIANAFQELIKGNRIMVYVDDVIIASSDAKENIETLKDLLSVAKRSGIAKELSARVSRWALILEEYEYTIVHRPGTAMRHVDALSRAPVMVVTSDPLIEMMITAQQRDDRIRAIRELVKTQSYDDYYLLTRSVPFSKFCSGPDLEADLEFAEIFLEQIWGYPLMYW